MNSKVVLGLIVVAVVAVVGFMALQQPEPAMVDTTTAPPVDVPVETTGMEKAAMADAEPALPESAMQAQKPYVEYSPEAFAAAEGKKRVLFFHATWCPTCKQAHADFEANAPQLPTNVVVFKTDYDTYSELKKQHGITYQHTFVEVDSAGQQVQKWNGGGVDQLISKLQ